MIIDTFKSPQSLLRATAPLAVPEILCSQFAHRISSGLTLSICAARCLRKRKCLPSRFGRLPPPLAALPCGPLPLLFARLLFRVAAKPSRFASLAPRQAAAQLLRSFVSATGGSRSKPTGSARKRPPLKLQGEPFWCGVGRKGSPCKQGEPFEY